LSRDDSDGVVVVERCEGVDGLVCGGHCKGVGAGFERTTKMESQNDSKFDARLNTAIYLTALYGVILYRTPYHQACFPRPDGMVTATVIWVPYSRIGDGRQPYLLA
jgi:hypothetical protein